MQIILISVEQISNFEALIYVINSINSGLSLASSGSNFRSEIFRFEFKLSVVRKLNSSFANIFKKKYYNRMLFGLGISSGGK